MLHFCYIEVLYITINPNHDISSYYFPTLNNFNLLFSRSTNLPHQQSCIRLEGGRVGTLHTNIVKAARGVLHGTKFYD